MHHQQIIFEIIRLIADYRYFVIFPLAVIEGPIVALVVGALGASGDLDPVLAFLILVAADLVGDAAYYSLGRFGHSRSFGALATRLGLTSDKLAPVERAFKKNEVKFLLFGKTQAFGSVILYTCGALKMRLDRFIGWNLVATVPKVLLFELIGYYFGQTVLRATKIFDAIGVATFIVTIALVVLYFLLIRSAERRFEGAIREGNSEPS
jgi:membrane protein DedA with SNARE-associated domain